MLMDIQEYCNVYHKQSGPVYLLVDGVHVRIFDYS